MDASTADAPRSGSRRKIIVAAVLVVAGAALFTWRTMVATGVPDGVVALSGRIEGDQSVISPKIGGRVLDVRVREGDSVKAGDTIAVVDDEQVRAREAQAQAMLAQAEARAKGAHDQVAVLEARLHEAQLQTEQSKADAAGRVRQAEADLAAAQAQLAQQQAAYQLALFDKDAYGKLAASGAVSERQGKQASLAADEHSAAVAAAEKRVEAAQGALATAKAGLTTTDIRAAARDVIQRQLTQQAAEISSATAQTDQARAQLNEAQANRSDLTIRAPFDGTVMTRAAEPGEFVTPGTAIVTLVDLSKVYLRGFVPEGQIGLVKAGQPARVYLDSSPKAPIDAVVSRIDPQATFTPENTYFREDRVKQVVGVKVELKGGVGFAKPGMPADGEILVSGGNWPRNSRRP